MWFRSLHDSLTARRSRPAGQRRGPNAVRPRPAYRLHFDALEDRSLPSNYIATDVGMSYPADVNASGQVVGVGTSLSWPFNHDHAFLWNNGQVIDLGTLGGTTSHAAAINDRGQVVGAASTGTQEVPFLLTPEDTNGDGTADRWFRDLDGDGANDLMTALDLPTWATSGGANDINGAGEVVGYALKSGQAAAMLWTTGGAFTDLGTLGGAQSVANGINDVGQVVGYSRNAAGDFRAFLWDGTSGMTDLGIAGGEAAAINNSGTVVGNVDFVDSSPVPSMAFAWTPEQPNGTTGTVTWLTGVDTWTVTTAARDINDAGQIVGSALHPISDTDTSDTLTPVLWENIQAEWAYPLLAAGLLHEAVAINAVGQIQTSRYLLTPTDGHSLLSIANVAVPEGHSGTTNAVFAVTRSGVLDRAVTVNFATADGSATAGTDYQAASGTLTFAPGETTKWVTVPVHGDRLFEPHETFGVSLTGATHAIVIDGWGVGTIADDEPRVLIDYVSRNEGNTGQTALTFIVRLSAAPDTTVTVDYTTADGSAVAGSDYQAVSGTLTFAPGETSKPLTVPLIGDRLPEDNEAFWLYLSSPTNAILGDRHAIGTVLDDEPRIRIDDVAMFEGRKSRTTLFTFTVTLSLAYDQPVTMSFRTVNDTATSGDNDYVARTGTLTFAPGETTKTITIEVKGDNRKEAQETFSVDLSGNSGNSLIVDGTGIGTIWNDD